MKDVDTIFTMAYRDRSDKIIFDEFLMCAVAIWEVLTRSKL